MKKKLFQNFSLFSPVSLTADKHSFANISAKFEMFLMRYSGARGKLIYEKNLMSKISFQTPFKGAVEQETFCLHFSFMNFIWYLNIEIKPPAEVGKSLHK
jgi:hypothetical protein